jgi:hypothetical protein
VRQEFVMTTPGNTVSGVPRAPVAASSPIKR